MKLGFGKDHERSGEDESSMIGYEDRSIVKKTRRDLAIVAVAAVLMDKCIENDAFVSKLLARCIRYYVEAFGYEKCLETLNLLKDEIYKEANSEKN